MWIVKLSEAKIYKQTFYFAEIIILMFILLKTAEAETWKIASLEYPPHTCHNSCKNNGSMGVALQTSLQTIGIKIEYKWLPWTRAINEAKKGKYIGYFPAWPEDCQKGFRFSETISRSRLGLVENVLRPLVYKNTKDLSQYKIGVVQDYGNTKELNRMISKGIIKTESSMKDESNIKKVALGRIDGALVDELVFQHLIRYQFPELKNQVQFNPVVLETKRLGICLKRSLYKDINQKLKEAFKRIDPEKTAFEYNKNLFKNIL